MLEEEEVEEEEEEEEEKYEIVDTKEEKVRRMKQKILA